MSQQLQGAAGGTCYHQSLHLRDHALAAQVRLQMRGRQMQYMIGSFNNAGPGPFGSVPDWLGQGEGKAFGPLRVTEAHLSCHVYKRFEG